MDPEGMLDWSWAEQRLQGAHNYWVCTTSAAGAPHVRPVWGVWLDGRLCFSTDPDGLKGRNIARDPRVTVHLESGAEVVIVEAIAESVAAELAEPVGRAYQRKYDFEVTVEPGGWYGLRPLRVYAWTEAEFQASVTRFDFDPGS
jgi:hypothetical protein